VQNFEIDYPDICKLDTIGFSVEGRAILVLKISDNVNVDEPEPEVFLTGQMHGDELVSYMIPLRLVNYLLSNYESDSRISNLVNNVEIWINPLSNPDGTYGDNENDVSESHRYNADEIDLNRNFPDPKSGMHPDENETAIENVAMIDFATERHFVLSANTHSGAEVVNYPWDTWETLHADDIWWQDVSRQYADQVHLDAPSGYLTDLDDGITNGYQWYSVNGGRQDYMNYFQHCREFILELSTQKLLDADQLPTYWNSNRDALITYFEQSLEGIHGIVTDSVTGNPLDAMVEIQGHDIDSSQVYSALPNGDYHRLISSGNWSLTFSKDGYLSKTVDVLLAEDASEVLDVELVPVSVASPIAEFSVSINAGIVDFINESQYAISYEWDFGDGQTSTEVSPQYTYNDNGEYSVELIAINENGENTIVHNITVSESDVPFEDVSDILLYPNPADQTVFIEFLNSSYPYEIELVDNIGRIIISEKYQESKIKINTQNFNNGFYFIRVIGEENSNLFKLIINH
jgi:translation initiation factor 2 beta subunit (eIF-2beta)/eIF-5